MAIDLEARARERSIDISKKFPDRENWKNVPFAKILTFYELNTEPLVISYNGNGHHPQGNGHSPEAVKQPEGRKISIQEAIYSANERLRIAEEERKAAARKDSEYIA